MKVNKKKIPRNGLYTEWYENGKKFKEEPYKDGKQDGLWTWWYENGQKEVQNTFKDGELVEVTGMWNEDGTVK